jgi:threonine dehydrogenase-like Zn-dependent dehydrogenase
VRVDTVPDPGVEDPRDAVIRVTSAAICGSDLHLYDGYVPTMKSGDVLGHETMGEVVAVGSEVKRLEVGDRVVIPFCISCGDCFFCRKSLFSSCDRSNPNAEIARKAMGQSPAGMFGYSHMMGGFQGGQADFLRVPYADVGALKVPDGMPDEQVLFLSDIFPTGYMAAENSDIEPGDTLAVWGCGPVGQFTIQSAWLLGAGRVIAIDYVPERLEMARRCGKAETLNFEDVDIYEQLMQMTNGRGPDRCVDAVGCEAHGRGHLRAIYDKAKATVGLTTDRAEALREAILCCRKGGTVSVPGVYVGFPDKIPFGALMNKGLTLKTGQTHVQRYMEPLLKRIQAGDIDPSFVITHRLPLDRAPDAYKAFRDKTDGCIKVVLKPRAA